MGPQRPQVGTLPPPLCLLTAPYFHTLTGQSVGGTDMPPIPWATLPLLDPV